MSPPPSIRPASTTPPAAPGLPSAPAAAQQPPYIGDAFALAHNVTHRQTLTPALLQPVDIGLSSGTRANVARKADLPAWRSDVEPLLDAQSVAARVRALGATITRDYADKCDAGVVLMGVLVGAFPFYADLIRYIDLPITCDFVRLSSYGAGQTSSGRVALKVPPSAELSGKHVIVVEDIVDTGFSMQWLLAHLHAQRPASVEVCTLLTKPSRMQVCIDAKYVGFEVPNEFVVGYGLDADGRYRNLPFIGVMRPAG